MGRRLPAREIGMSATNTLRPQALLATLTLGAILLGQPAGAGSAQALVLEGGGMAATVAWPASDGLVVGELVTRGAAASDQYAEIYNGATASRSLANLELVYVTASGATVTRKASWSAGSLAPGQRLLVANAAGAYAALADATFSGGFSTSGGALVLRVIGGTVIDALSWGTAASAFVEGSAASAPPTGSSLERKPGAGAGNWTDTNDNLADTWINPAPAAENLDSPPAPRPAQGIAAIRDLPLGTSVTLDGRLTTPALLADGLGAFVQDDFGGIAVLTDGEQLPSFALGSQVGAQGVLDRHFGLLVVRLASAADLWWQGEGTPPLPVEAAIGDIGEALEATLVRLEGEIISSEALDDGLWATLDDGGATLTVIAPALTGIDASMLGAGEQVALTGVVSRHDVEPEGAPQFLLYLRSAGDIVPIESQPPAPTHSPSPTAAPSASPTAAPSASPTATPSPVLDIALARQHPLGSQVSVQGIVTVPPGRILGDRTLAIQDASGGICVRLADTGFAGLTPGRLVSVTGELAAPYGNLELRPAATGVTPLGSAARPAPLDIAVAELGEEVEGLLVRVEGAVRRIDTGTGTITLIVADGSAEGRIFIHAPLGLSKDDFHTGQRLRVTGVAGDRLGLYRVWPADVSDIVVLADPPSGGGGGGGGGRGGGPTPTPGSSAEVSTIARALTQVGKTVTVEGTVTVGAGLIDADGRRIVIQDSTAAVLARLPAGASPPAVGRRIRIRGSVGSFYNAPQLAVTDPPQLLGSAAIAPAEVRGAPVGASLEWRLVRVSGTFERVTRSGDTWRAELKLAAGSLPVVGLARSNIGPPVGGRAATVVGIVRRAYPTASDQRFALVPRSAADITYAADRAPGGDGPSADRPDGAGGPGTPNGPAADGGSSAPAVALADLGDHVGSVVRVGGRIVALYGERLVLADDSGRGTVRLASDARALLATLAVGDVLNVTGLVSAASVGFELVVDRPEDVRLAAMLAPRPTAPPTSLPSATPAGGEAGVEAAAPQGNEGVGWLSLLALGALSGMVAVRVARRRLDPRLLIARFLATRRGRVRI
jgi:DNA/RNA endonuclease YhcR with UshA esterase domain